jgi:hypothetical protein
MFRERKGEPLGDSVTLRFRKPDPVTLYDANALSALQRPHVLCAEAYWSGGSRDYACLDLSEAILQVTKLGSYGPIFICNLCLCGAQLCLSRGLIRKATLVRGYLIEQGFFFAGLKVRTVQRYLATLHQFESMQLFGLETRYRGSGFVSVALQPVSARLLKHQALDKDLRTSRQGGGRREVFHRKSKSPHFSDKLVKSGGALLRRLRVNRERDQDARDCSHVLSHNHFGDPNTERSTSTTACACQR